MRRSISSLVGLVAVTFAGLATGTPQAAAGSPAQQASAASEHRRIVEYWTPGRRASAIPRDLTRPAPNARPGVGGGSSTVAGATWTQGGSVTVTTGKVFFNLGASRYTCSASAVEGAAGNLVVTAGHCVHNGNGGGFASNWIFYPRWNGAPDPVLGAWTATDLFTTPGWATGSTEFDDDTGFAVVTGGAGSPSLFSVLSAAGGTVPGIVFGTSTGTSYAFGYPASKKYKGNTLTYCTGLVRDHYDGNNTMALACDMTGGSSGGPWLQPFTNGATTTDAIFSLNSYGYASLANTMFGPIFDTAEANAYAAASGTPDCTAGATYRCVDHTD
jgi:hypothetical protein